MQDGAARSTAWSAPPSRAMLDRGARTEQIIAVVGPCIGPESYEVGPEFPTGFLKQDRANERFFTEKPNSDRLLFDLPAFVKSRLTQSDIVDANITGHDTYSDDSFFSYRRSCHRAEPGLRTQSVPDHPAGRHLTHALSVHAHIHVHRSHDGQLVRFSFLSSVLMALVACQPVPRPFEADRKAPNTLLQQADFRGIRVLPIADAPPANGRKAGTEHSRSAARPECARLCARGKPVQPDPRGQGDRPGPERDHRLDPWSNSTAPRSVDTTSPSKGHRWTAGLLQIRT